MATSPSEKKKDGDEKDVPIDLSEPEKSDTIANSTGAVLTTSWGSSTTSSTVLTEDEKWSEENFENQGTLFEGIFCKTYKICHKETSELAFLRVCRKHYRYKSKYLSEEYIWSLASPHPYIARLYSSYAVADSKYYISEYFCRGNLRNFIQVHKVLQTKVAQLLTAQIASAIEFLHKKEIFHREVSNRHIILSADGMAKLSNFQHALMNRTSRGVHGNLYYQAPEVFSGGIYDRTADWYSLGVCLYEMVMSMTPVEYHCKRKGIFFKKLDYTGKIVVLLTSSVYIPKMFPKSLKDILEGLLQENNEDRFGYKEHTEDLKNHSFFQNVNWNSLESGLLKVDLPGDERGSFEDHCHPRIKESQ